MKSMFEQKYNDIIKIRNMERILLKK
jgi:hypothetical protein